MTLTDNLEKYTYNGRWGEDKNGGKFKTHIMGTEGERGDNRTMITNMRMMDTVGMTGMNNDDKYLQNGHGGNGGEEP